MASRATARSEDQAESQFCAQRLMWGDLSASQLSVNTIMARTVCTLLSNALALYAWWVYGRPGRRSCETLVNRTCRLQAELFLQEDGVGGHRPGAHTTSSKSPRPWAAWAAGCGGVFGAFSLCVTQGSPATACRGRTLIVQMLVAGAMWLCAVYCDALRRPTRASAPRDLGQGQEG